MSILYFYYYYYYYILSGKWHPYQPHINIYGTPKNRKKEREGDRDRDRERGRGRERKNKRKTTRKILSALSSKWARHRPIVGTQDRCEFFSYFSYIPLPFQFNNTRKKKKCNTRWKSPDEIEKRSDSSKLSLWKQLLNDMTWLVHNRRTVAIYSHINAILFCCCCWCYLPLFMLLMLLLLVRINKIRS